MCVALLATFAVLTFFAWVGSFAERAIALENEAPIFYTSIVLAAMLVSLFFGTILLCLNAWIIRLASEWSGSGYLFGIFFSPIGVPYFLWMLRASRRRPGFDVPMDD